MIPPVAARPISMPPIRPGVESVSIRAVVVARRIVGVGRPIESRERDWDWQADENSSFGLRLGQHHGAESKRSNQEKFSHSRLIFQTSNHVDRLLLDANKIVGIENAGGIVGIAPGRGGEIWQTRQT